MKSRCFAARCRKLIAVCLAFLCAAIEVEAKQIRLRNGIISTSSPAKAQGLAVNQTNDVPVSGLFLIQFTETPESAWRQQLNSMGVDLLRYVPDDTFIARFKKVSLNQVSALSFVTWVGPYQPEYKVHPGLLAAAQEALKTNAAVNVTLLISARASRREIMEVRSLLAAAHRETHLRQGIVLHGVVAPDRLNALAQSSSVLWIERTAKRKLNDEAAAKIVGGDDGATGTPTITQQEGFNGAGVTVAIADTGLDTGDTNTMTLDLRGRVKALLYYGTATTDAADEHSHGTHVAGIVAGNAAIGEVDASGARYGLGVAPGAELLVQRIFDADGNTVDPLPSDETLTHDAVRAGAKIGSNSWGTDVQGGYDIDCATFDELVRDADTPTPGDQPYILEFSAGNAGPAAQTLDSPAAAKNVIATGASENGGQLDFGIYNEGPDTVADFSSRGPCEDGRIKPDVVAPGTFIASLLSAAASDQFAWLPISPNYIYMGGTSQAGPHAAGAAAVFVQYYRSLHTNAVPSPALVKAALINSAEELDQANGGPGPIPNYDEGWGRVNVANIIITNRSTAPRVFETVDQTVPLTNGQVFQYHTFVRSADEPLKITMAYTDEPGFSGAIPALVNDLDLEVVAPDGTIFHGNQFDAGESVPNAPSADSINNVEGVYIAQPAPGDYLVKVRARKVVQDARGDTPAMDQDFALVISGDLSRTGIGDILLDRSKYTAPSAIQAQVFDSGRAASNSISTVVTNLTAPNGQTVSLTAVSGVPGLFSGTLPTVAGGAPVAGKLAIENGNAIEARYVDSLGVTRAATATARLLPPVLNNVEAATDLGLMTITWQTDEPADSIVRFGTNLTFNLAVTNSELTTTHQIRLANLASGRTNHFFVSSTDEAGNTATNNNSGGYYTFVSVATPAVLFVNAYEQADGSPIIEDSAYTNALAATGYSFAVWKVVDRGVYPQLADLKPFQAVIWRVTDDAINYTGTNNTINAGQQFMIQSYLNGGGSFFMASMEILSRLGNSTFLRDVLHVGRFVVNNDPLGLPCSNCDEDFGVPAITGRAGNLITSGLDVTLDYTNYPYLDVFGDGSIIYGPDFSDTFTPTTNSTAIVFEPASGRVCGVSYPRPELDSPGRVVFLSFPLDAIMADGSSPNNETNLLRNILKFLVPGVNGVGELSLDATAYTIPSLVTVEVGDSDLAGTAHTHVIFSTSSFTNQVTIILDETPHAGLFRGFITLVATNAPATNQLRVVSGDTITAKYFDASAGSNAITTAIIDTQPPVITNISIIPKHFEATVSWKTSKPADALVQFGESKLLGRTAYVSVLDTNHSVTLSGLVSGRSYFYQVVSRDYAGNTAVDDKAGDLYDFQTLPPIQTSWSNNLESGASGWTVVAGDSSQVNWELGVPQNGRETAAHSGTNAWGSNLNGQAIDYTDTYLYSPPINLNQAGEATLTFWHSFDFTSPDLIELGELMIATNFVVDQAVSYVTYTNTATTGWEKETVELTPFVGNTIMVVWHYAEFTFGGNTPPYGWLVDDVSITFSNAASGTIQITNNIWQAQFVLTGPTNTSGKGVGMLITNAPTGQYVITFGTVPYYQTPAPQTNTLLASSNLLFQGNYTFADLNANGIADAWEQYYFGEVSTNRTALTDTDHDGMTDYAEFIAGTDPNSPPPTFKVTASLTNALVRLDWPTAPGHNYRIHRSTNGTSWTPFSNWIPATGPATNVTFAPTLVGAPNLFRVEVADGSGPNTLAPDFRVTAQLLTNGAVRLEWTSTADRGYRVIGSTNATTWTPYSDWIQAITTNTLLTLPPRTNGAPYLFKVEVRP